MERKLSFEMNSAKNEKEMEIYLNLSSLPTHWILFITQSTQKLDPLFGVIHIVLS